MTETSDMLIAGARAVGLLSVLIDWGHVPAVHMKAAKEIMEQYERGQPGWKDTAQEASDGSV